MRTNLQWFSAEGRTSLAGQLLKDSGSSSGDTSSTISLSPSSSASKNSGVENFGDMATSPAEGAAAAASTASNQGSSNDEVLEIITEMYRGEIEDLRHQLRESQEARHREEEAQREIVELRRQLELTEKAPHTPVPTPAEGATTNTIDSEAVTNALTYLDQVIQRISSKKSTARTKTTGSMRRSEDDTKQASDVNNADKKVVELEFCPALHRKVSADTEDGSENSWRPAGTIQRLMDDMSSVATSSLPGTEGGGTSPIPFGQSSIMSSIYGTANGDASSASALSWQPTAAMAALVAGMSDDSTVNTWDSTINAWLTAGDDDFDDMHTCLSALTSPIDARSRGTGSIASKTSTNVSKDDTAAVISQLYQIQSLLLAILKDKEADSKAGVMRKNEDKASPNIELQMSSRSKSIANWKNQIDGDDKRNDQQQSEKRNDKQKKRSDNQSRRQLTKEDAEQIISSLAAIF